jgi:hypothetical protein
MGSFRGLRARQIREFLVAVRKFLTMPSNAPKRARDGRA